MSRVMLPIGIESFRELREKNCYYIDKTRFIEELMNDSFKVLLSVSRTEYSDSFGFTKAEVWKLLEDTELKEHAESIRKWYDGYQFGKISIYCPWDVLNYVRALQNDSDAEPENYWRNTSHNGIIRSFIDRTDLAVHDKFECLL